MHVGRDKLTLRSSSCGNNGYYKVQLRNSAADGGTLRRVHARYKRYNVAIEATLGTLRGYEVQKFTTRLHCALALDRTKMFHLDGCLGCVHEPEWTEHGVRRYLRECEVQCTSGTSQGTVSWQAARHGTPDPSLIQSMPHDGDWFARPRASYTPISRRFAVLVSPWPNG